ncbi:MAG: transposase [Oligoflexia bacterium]|nr:transposase [Oligoflexia bacterium]
MAIDEIEFPDIIITDNDGIYGQWLTPIFKEYFGIEIIKIPFQQPWCNGRIERMNKTIQCELLNRIILSDLKHIQSQLSKYKSYYNEVRPHQGINGKTPKYYSNSPTVLRKDIDLFEKRSHVDGLMTSFHLAA